MRRDNPIEDAELRWTTAQQVTPAHAVHPALAIGVSVFGRTRRVEHDQRELLGLQRRALVDEHARVGDDCREFSRRAACPSHAAGVCLDQETHDAARVWGLKQ